MTDQHGPLSHLKVLDFTQLLQGPLATQILADLGADVIKFEKPGGEWMRHWGILASRTHGEMDSFLAFNRNKRSVAVDLKDPAAVAAILRLAEDADVVVENFRPGVMDRLGLGYDAFAARNPELVYASSSGYGQSGPYAGRPGQDLLAQAMTGALTLTGRRDDPPLACGIGIADEYTGMHLVTAILAALCNRDAGGGGQRVAVDLFSCTVAAQQQELTVHLNRDEPLQRAAGNVGHVGGTAPFGIYGTADGHLALAMMALPRLGQILGVAWLDEFDSDELAFRERDRVHALLDAHFGTDTTARWLELLDAHDVWCAPVQDHDQLERDPQLAHAGLLWEVPVGDDPEATFRTVGSPFSFSKTPPRLRRGVPRAGQDTAAVLGALEPA
ncbi:CoA transferase [Conexibacter stalactiti]|uniref:CoA transferase n=1 Tax=Conexibacter stalactiti TaxID=1940611 RepID=A0ABU4HZX0_9ACTN|nr:CoA transferase [Conexibacter stalactiti]MDW5598855.1 CoA transferase [Conexibacter stalactiti]MEC5039497.1 CoA transferase [Conexibacter stalactiti]